MSDLEKMNRKLVIVGGNMVLRFSRGLTEKEYNKIVKLYSSLSWKIVKQSENIDTLYFVKGA